MPALDPLMQSPVFLGVTILAVLIAGIAKGGFGAGAAFASTPLIALVAPPTLALSMMLPILILMDAFGLRAYWRRWNWPTLKPLLIGAAMGIGAGALFFRFVDPAALKIMIGAVALAFVIWRALPLRPATRRPDETSPSGSMSSALFWGGVSGFTSMTAHAGGPPVAVHLLRVGLDKTAFQATTVAFFAAVNALKLAPFIAIGLISQETLTLSLIFAPLAPLGIWLGVLAHRRLPEAIFFRLVIVLLTATALKLIWDGIGDLG